MRIFLGAFGDPGHAFPMMALGTRLVERGHEVCLHTWRKWTDDVQAAGMSFTPAPEFQVFPTLGRHLLPYEAAVVAARDSVPVVRDLRPDVCVSDILTLAPALASEVCGVPVATLVPHVCPMPEPGLPPFAAGALPPRTAIGRRVWSAADRLVDRGLVRGRDDYNEARASLGLPPRAELHGGLSRGLTMVATLPQLEYPRAWPDWMTVVGPLFWEPPGDVVAVDQGAWPGDPPVVLVAPSTAQDAEHTLLRAALDGLARERVRVIATWNGREPPWLPGYRVPDNAVLVPWLSYAKTMPECDLVVTHGGHGTLVRALTSGCAVVVSPSGGDMFENAARAEWAGAGVRLPKRLLGAATLRLAVRRALGRPALRARAQEIAAWSAAHDAADAAAGAVEAWGARVAMGQRPAPPQKPAPGQRPAPPQRLKTGDVSGPHTGPAGRR
jgi:UDP:flavonoid glycosyltransferase YjiC (YdhE family)